MCFTSKRFFCSMSGKRVYDSCSSCNLQKKMGIFVGVLYQILCGNHQNIVWRSFVSIIDKHFAKYVI